MSEANDVIIEGKLDYEITEVEDKIGEYKRGMPLGQTYTGFIYSAYHEDRKEVVYLIHVYPDYKDMKWEVCLIY